MDLVRVGEFVLAYLPNPTSYRRETCTIGYSKDWGLKECVEILWQPHQILELWTSKISYVSWIWFGLVDLWYRNSWTLQAMDMRLAPLDTDWHLVFHDIWCSMTSGVPQRSSLGPLLFIIYINDIRNSLTSSTKLFADDCVLYREINTIHDAECLQRDLSYMFDWSHTWQLNSNVSKCKVMCIAAELAEDWFQGLRKGWWLYVDYWLQNWLMIGSKV